MILVTCLHTSTSLLASASTRMPIFIHVLPKSVAGQIKLWNELQNTLILHSRICWLESSFPNLCLLHQICQSYVCKFGLLLYSLLGAMPDASSSFPSQPLPRRISQQQLGAATTSHTENVNDGHLNPHSLTQHHCHWKKLLTNLFS